MENLYIFPYNGNGIEALDCLSNHYNLLGFIDDTPEKQGVNEYGLSVFSRKNIKDKDAVVLAVPGSPTSYKIRKQIIDSLEIPIEKFATVIHPNASVSPLAKIGKNVLIMAGVVITSNAIIEDHVCILPNTVIHHDVVVGKYSLIGSNISIAGSTKIGENCYIGSGTKIMNGLSIGDRTLVGLGTNIIRSIPNDSKVVGNPARIL